MNLHDKREDNVMNLNEIKLITDAVENAGFEFDDSKPINEIYEDAYQFMREYAIENQDSFEVVEGEFWNHYSHLHAQSADGTNYECDGQIIDGNETGGEVVGDFIDKSGKMVLVVFPKDED